MSTGYSYKKCNLFGFATTVEKVTCKYGFNTYVYDDNNIFQPFDESFIEEINSNITCNEDVIKHKEYIPTFIFDLESKQFDDIIIATDTNNNKNEQSIKNYKHDDNELNKIMTGQTVQLDAFTKNIYTVIYGKKSANIENGMNNTHIFNHNVIDSLAKNGIIVDQQTIDKKLSVHIIMEELEKLRKFNVYFVHSSLDIPLSEFESPNEISHPMYIKGNGEITAVFYRSLLLKFFPYLTIVTESMRENAYLF